MTRTGPPPHQPPDAPSAWIRRFTPLVPAGATVLDVACGLGRHLRWFARLGFETIGIDRDAVALAAARGCGALVCADLEGAGWPLGTQRFGAVVVTNYLWRPLLPAVAASVAEGGVLLYETFARGQEMLGRPKRAEFLLQPGELLRLCPEPTWHIVAYEHGCLAQPARMVQRIAAIRAPTAAERYPL